jgi:hypothetical protein
MLPAGRHEVAPTATILTTSAVAEPGAPATDTDVGR